MFCLCLEAKLIKNYTIEQDTSPRLSFAHKHFRKFHRQYDSFLNDLFSLLQSSHVIPFYIRLLSNDRICDLTLQLLLFFRILFFLNFLRRLVGLLLGLLRLLRLLRQSIARHRRIHLFRLRLFRRL